MQHLIPLALPLLFQVAPLDPGAAPTAAPTAEVAPAEAPPSEPSAEATAAPAETPAPAAPVAAETPAATAETTQEPNPEAAAATPVPAASEAAEEKEEPNPLGVNLDKIHFKPGKGLVFESRDGTFGMALRSRIQLRHEYYHNENADEGDLQESHLFNVRRARFTIGGHFFGKHNKYKLQLALSPRDENFSDSTPTKSPVLDAILEFDYLRDATLTAGQYMVPFNRQRIVSSGDFELIDRSIASSEYQLDRDIGLQLSSNDLFGLGHVRYLAAVFNGEGRDADSLQDGGLLYVGRLEVLPTGDSEDKWDYEEGDLAHTKKPLISLGAAYAYQDDALRNRGVMGKVPTDGGTTDMHLVTADFVAQWLGMSLTGELYFRDATRDYGDATADDGAGGEIPAPQETARDGMGWFIQGGYVLPGIPLGFAARYSVVNAKDDDYDSLQGDYLKDSREIGGGPSWYIGGHDFKLQADYFRRYSDDISEGEDFVRTQLTAGF